MSDRLPRIIVSLPARSAEAARAEAELARASGADLAEIRLDRWPSTELENLPRLFPSPLPLLATYRSRAEGGAGSDDPAERSELLQRFVAHPFRWVDLELARDLAILPRLPPSEKVGRIVSVHMGPATPAAWSERIEQLAALPGDVGKLVVRASVLDTLRELVPRLPPPEEASLVTHTVGASGPLLRALARRLGFPFVYASLPAGNGRDPVEPSQIPVDRLRRFLAADSTAPLFAVAGRPVGHSRSPGLHSGWMRAEGRHGLYIPLEFETDEEFVLSLPYLAAAGFRGINVTQPFKSIAFEAATTASKGAESCGAANCLTLRDGAVEAENTDLVALLQRLGELREAGRWDGGTLGVIGAGGSARATLAAARALSAKAVVCARRPEAADALAKEFSATVGRTDEARPLPLVVHATNAGRAGAGPLEIPLGPWVGPGSHVIDWVYDAAEPAVRTAATAAGASYEDGWRLLVYQAAESYALWWGSDPEPNSLAEALREGGCAA